MKQLKKIVALIENTERPMIFAGGGVILSKASDQLTELARKTRIPVTTSLMGLGAFPETDPVIPGDDRHARHLQGQYGHVGLRPVDIGWGPV